MIVGITGKIGSGKSTMANYLTSAHGYEEYSFAKPLKEIGRLFGFSDKQLYGTQEQKLEIHPYWGISARYFLQKMGTDLFRDLLPTVIPEIKKGDNTIWVELFKLKYKEEPKLYVVSDVRFLDEAKIIKDLGGIIIRTERNNSVTSESGNEHLHKSELGIEKIVPDYVVDNNLLSISDMQRVVDEILTN